MGNAKKPDLLPCPLCQGRPRLNRDSIECTDCGLYLSKAPSSFRYGGYIALWNTRAEDHEDPMSLRHWAETERPIHYIKRRRGSDYDTDPTYS